MQACRGCGAHSLRVRTLFDEHANFIREECIECSPSSFGAIENPSDKKIWTGIAAEPDRYKQYTINGETQYFASDELKQDLVDMWSKDDLSVNTEKVRRTRRLQPSTLAEQRSMEVWGREVLRPMLEKQKLNAQYAHID